MALPAFMKRYLLFVGLILLLHNAPVCAQKTGLPHSTPEAQGVSSAGIDSFLTAVNRSKNEFHSFMLLRHGKVVAQGWWNPYSRELKHTMYSCSKSFTSTAIGFLVSEKKLSLYDKVISFFPNSLPDTVKPYLRELSIRDLLTMSVGQPQDPTFYLPIQSNDWVKSFLALPITDKPGTKFLYNSMATFMLSAIVQRVTGKKEYDYLKPRLFDPLGITGIDWETDNHGINTGGWGLRLKTEDMAKFGQFYLQKGKWSGKQLLPAKWIEEATGYKIDQAPDTPKNRKAFNDWMQGYCYQFWRCQHNAFRGDGALGQYIIVMPDQDAVIAITSESVNMQAQLDAVWTYLLPAMKPHVLHANPTAYATLRKHLAALHISPAGNSAKPGIALNGAAKTWSFQPNSLNIKSISLRNDKGIYHLTLKTDSASYTFELTSGKWTYGLTKMQGPSLLMKAKENFAFLVPYRVECCYGWTDTNTLQMKLRYIESPHTETITCHFKGQNMDTDVAYSFYFGSNKLTLHGKQ